MTTPEPSHDQPLEPQRALPKRNRVVLLAVAAFLAGVLATVVVVLIAGGDRFEYDEQAHQAAVEDYIGHEIADWDTYRDVVQEVCDEDESGFGMFIAVTADEEGIEGLARLKLDIRYACPEREEEFDEVINSLPIGG